MNDVEALSHVDRHHSPEYILLYFSTSWINRIFFAVTNESS